ncbi:MAG: zinc ribbon domain-containing protein [Thermoflexia bacterium]|nr:MAG: zinc ribbon domain-containing protein [Thermoflexia bacterium]
MPVYEYQCKACGVRFERVQRFSDDPVRVCPECGGEVYRLLQPVGIIFKGSGFYATDHRSSSSTTAAGKKSSKSESSEKASTNSEGED